MIYKTEKKMIKNRKEYVFCFAETYNLIPVFHADIDKYDNWETRVVYFDNRKDAEQYVRILEGELPKYYDAYYIAYADDFEIEYNIDMED